MKVAAEYRPSGPLVKYIILSWYIYYLAVKAAAQGKCGVTGGNGQMSLSGQGAFLDRAHKACFPNVESGCTAGAAQMGLSYSPMLIFIWIHNIIILFHIFGNVCVSTIVSSVRLCAVVVVFCVFWYLCEHFYLFYGFILPFCV